MEINQKTRPVLIHKNPKDSRVEGDETLDFHHWIKPEWALLENKYGQIISVHFSEFMFTDN